MGAGVPGVRQVAGELGCPRTDRQRSENRCQQIEGTETQLPERETALARQLQLPQQLPGALPMRTRQSSGPCSR